MYMFMQFRNTVYSCLPHADIVADKYHVIRQANWMIRDVRIRLFNSDEKYKEQGIQKILEADSKEFK